MEELNKNQIVLLVLLVSFVTSIATGIVTVTLMDQAPPAVTQTINRIVERTVEKVVPGQPSPPVVKEVPVIVTEEELIVKVINGAMPGVVRIVGGPASSAGGQNDKPFLGSGFFVSADGVIVADGAEIAAATSTTSYQAVIADGRIFFPLTKLVSPSADLSFFKLTASSAGSPVEDNKDGKWSALALAKVSPAAGQSVVALGYSDRPDINVSVGIVSSFLSTGKASTTPLVMTNAASLENQGGPLLNIKGEVIGISKGSGLAIPTEMIIAALKEIK